MQAPTTTVRDAEDRKRIAREHSALFPTRLALARWTSSNEPHHLHDHLPLRAAWLARAQRDFQSWLDRGGFTQHDKEHTDTGQW